MNCMENPASLESLLRAQREAFIAEGRSLRAYAATGLGD